MLEKFLSFCLLAFFTFNLNAQGRFSGDVQLNVKVFDRDEDITPDTEFYRWAFSGMEMWFNLNYVHESDLEIGLRLDAFNNSDLFSGGQTINNGVGIGRFYVKKRIDKLSVEVGHIYDQIGNGFIYRTYENRGLGLDSPLLGIQAKYDLGENVQFKAFGGKLKSISQFVGPGDKDLFEVFEPFVKGVNLEGNFQIGESGVRFSPGYGFVNRTTDLASINQIANSINSQPLETRFVPRHNAFVHSFYTSVYLKNWTILAEYAWKSEDTLRDSRLNSGNFLINEEGQVFYSSIGYSVKGFGISASFRDTKFFDFRTSANQGLFNGIINFIPPLARQNSLRLPARYQSNAQFLDETGYQLDAIYSPKKGLVFTANYSYIEDDNGKLFQEVYVDAEIKKKGSDWKFLTGFNLVDYNLLVYQGPGKSDWVNTISPFFETTYKITRKKSIRAEAQYLLTKRQFVLGGEKDPNPDQLQDLGDWVYGLVEFNIAPKYSVSASDMYSIDTDIHYYDFSVFYTEKASRFALSFVRQVEGIVCTGGVCRFEPAFNGLKIGMTTSF